MKVCSKDAKHSLSASMDDKYCRICGAKMLGVSYLVCKQCNSYMAYSASTQFCSHCGGNDLKEE